MLYRGCTILLIRIGLYGNSCVTGLRFTIDKVKQDIDDYRDKVPEPPEPPEPEPEELIEVYRGVEIWWIPNLQRYRAIIEPGLSAISATLEGIRADIDEILDVVEPPPDDEWPWPLNGVQEWFNGLRDNVVSAPMNALNAFWTTHMLPKLDWIQDRLAESIEWVYDQIKPIMDDISTAIGNVWTGITTTITDMWNDLTITMVNIGDWIDENIKPALDDISTTITETWNNVSTNIQNGLDSLIANISSGLESLGTTMGNALDAYFTWKDNNDQLRMENLGVTINENGQLILTESQNMLSEALAGGMDWVTKAISGVAGALGDGLSAFLDGMLKSLGNIAEMIFGAVNFVIAKLKDGVMWLMGDFLNVITDAMSPGSPPEPIRIAAKVLSETTWEKQMDMIDSAYHSEPTLGDLLQSATSLQSVLLAAATVAIGAGIAADMAHPLKNMGFRPTVREMVYWMGIPSVTAAMAVLPTSIGLLEPLRYELNAKWTPHVPPANDLVRFALREVWDETRWEALIAYYPGQQYANLMAKHGYKADFAEYYWMAHWVLPSVGQLNEMLYRGKITGDVWEDFVRYNDYIPEMIPRLKEIIYKPYTRVDSRRMWDLGVLTDSEIYENFQWLGYDEEHARTMTTWTKAYVIAGDIRALYSKGWIDEHGAREMIVEAGIPAERADVFLKRLVQVQQPSRMEGERDLTKTDLLRMLKSGILTEPQTIDMLVGLGYDGSEAFYLVQLYTYTSEIDLKELTMSQILKAYRYEIYSRDKAKLELEEAGWAAEAAETLLVLEDVKLKDAKTERARERDLSRTDITRSVDFEIITKDTGFNYLAYLGYSEWEINVIFALAGIE